MKGVNVLRAGAVLYVLGISYLSHQPSLTPPLGLPDWLMHGMEFAGLGVLVGGALAAGPRGLTPARWTLGAAACALFGVLDELHQSFVPGRDAAVGDAIADASGAAMALAALALVSSVLRRPSRRPEIVLLGRGDCHLCDEAERVLEAVLPGRGLTFEKVDIDSRDDLRAVYKEEIPVVLIEGRKAFKHRIDPERLRRKLDSIQRRRA